VIIIGTLLALIILVSITLLLFWVVLSRVFIIIGSKVSKKYNNFMQKWNKNIK